MRQDDKNIFIPLGKRHRDANDMNDAFYRELLYIIGLEEKSEKGNVTIQRRPMGQREPGSLLEGTLSFLAAHDSLSEEDKYDAALELVLTWVNRLLFIKLVESQVISFNSSDDKEKYEFFTEEKIKNFRSINDLFFKVLALPKENRDDEVSKRFPEVPYLNSKLFECTHLEHRLSTKISSLRRLSSSAIVCLALRPETCAQGIRQDLEGHPKGAARYL